MKSIPLSKHVYLSFLEYTIRELFSSTFQQTPQNLVIQVAVAVERTFQHASTNNKFP